MRAANWLLLDNLIHRWEYYTNMERAMADEAMAWAVKNGFVVDGEITESGKGYFLIHQRDPIGGNDGD